MITPAVFLDSRLKRAGMTARRDTVNQLGNRSSKALPRSRAMTAQRPSLEGLCYTLITELTDRRQPPDFSASNALI